MCFIFRLYRITYLYFLMFPAKDIKISQERTTAAITERSKRLMTTMGEWELLDISSQKYTGKIDGNQDIDELVFYVC